MRFKFFKYLFLSGAIFFICASPASAIQLRFDNDSVRVPVDQLFRLNVQINPEKQCLNIVKTAISFPVDQLEFKEFDYSDSIVGLWIESPKVSDGKISFTAGLPRGYCQDPFNREQNIILKLIFKAKSNQGSAKISYDESQTKIFLNDGQGTPSTFSLNGVLVMFSGNKIINSQSTGQPTNPAIVNIDNLPSASDHEAPVDLVVNAYQENGRYYTAFYASDRQSGIDYYEVSFGANDFVKASSPLEVRGDNLYLPFRVRAVDRAGNNLTVSSEAILLKYSLIIYFYIVGTAILIFGLLLFWFFKTKKNKGKKYD